MKSSDFYRKQGQIASLMFVLVLNIRLQGCLSPDNIYLALHIVYQNNKINRKSSFELKCAEFKGTPSLND